MSALNIRTLEWSLAGRDLPRCRGWGGRGREGRLPLSQGGDSRLSSTQGIGDSGAKTKQCVFLSQTFLGFRYILKGGNPKNEEEMKEALAEGEQRGRQGKFSPAGPGEQMSGPAGLSGSRKGCLQASL